MMVQFSKVTFSQYQARYSPLTVLLRTQPLCYCQGLKLINCKMVDCDLAFERSQVQATLTAPILSIKNPLTGSRITVPQVGEIIRDIDGAEGEVLVEKAKGICA